MTAAHEQVGERAPGEVLPEATGQLRLMRHNPALRRLVVSLFLLQVGQSTTWVGIPLLVIERYGLGLDAGLTTGLIVIPNIFLGVAVGNLVDRTNPRNLLMVSAVFSGLLVTLFPFTAALWQIQLLAVTVGIGYMFIMPAMLVLRPRVMDAGSEMSGNGLVVTAQRLALLAGPTLSGPIIGLAGLSWIFGFEAVTAIGAALLLARLAVRTANAHQPGKDEGGTDRAEAHAAGERPAIASLPTIWGQVLVSSVRSIVDLVRGDRKLAALTITVFTYLIAYGLGNILLASYSLDTFRHFPGMLGYLLGALGVGGAAGALLVPRLARIDRGLLYLSASILEGIVWAFVPFIDAAAGALVLLFMAGLLESAATVVFFAEVQPRLSVEYTGRYWAMVLPVTDACLLLGRSLGGFMIPAAGVHWTAVVICIIFVSPVVLLAAPILRGDGRQQSTTSPASLDPTET